jgi:hypothetical protein
MCLQVWEENCAEIWKHFADVAQKKGTASLDIKLTALPLPFLNPQLLEQPSWSLSPSCFHWDTTYSSAERSGTVSAGSKALVVFQKGQSRQWC